MKARWSALWFLLAAETGRTLEAQKLTIDFDEDPNGLPVPGGTVINSVYEAQGVSFDHVGPGALCGDTPEVFASEECLGQGAPSPPNVVTLCGPDTCSDISEVGFGMVRASFQRPAREVCIDVVPVNGEHAGALRAFDVDAELLQEVISTPGVPESICIAAPGIRAVTFSGAGRRFAWFDNLTIDFRPAEIGPFLRGDCNHDGAVNLSDAICVLDWLFLGGPAPGCLAAANADGAGEDIGLTDAVYLLEHLFRSGPALVAPFPACGTSDLEADVALGCGRATCP